MEFNFFFSEFINLSPVLRWNDTYLFDQSFAAFVNSCSLERDR